IGGLRTDPKLVQTLTRFVRRIGKHPVVATDTPGFVVNHAGRAYGPEALRTVAQGIASPREVDLLMKEAAGFRMGPFELLDLVGGDVTHAVMVSIYNQYFGEPMYQPSAQMTVRVAAGLLGRKSKQGFYDYGGAPAASPPTLAVPAMTKPADAWVADEEGGTDLAQWLDMPGRFASRRTVMKTPLTSAETLGAAVAALSYGVPVTVINDSTGFVVQRLLAMIVNVGTRIAEL